LNFIDTGKIKGKDLVRLCNTSSKLRQLCLKNREYTDAQGRILETIPQYVYSKALQEAGLKIEPGDIPSENYVKSLSGLQLWEGTRFKVEKNQGMNYCKQIVKIGKNHTIILDVFGKVYYYLSASIGQSNRELTQFPDLTDIIQVAVGEYCIAALDSKGSVWTVGNLDLAGLPHHRYSYTGTFKRINPAVELSKTQMMNIPRFKQVTCSDTLAVLDTDGYAFVSSKSIDRSRTDSVLYYFVHNVKWIKAKSKLTSEIPGQIIDLLYIDNKNVLFQYDQYNKTSIRIFDNVLNAVPNGSKIIFITADGKLYIYDPLFFGYYTSGCFGEQRFKLIGQTIIEVIHSAENLRPADNLKFVKIDASREYGYAIDSRGYLYSIILDLSGDSNYIEGFGYAESGRILDKINDIIVDVSVNENDELAILTRNR
jgi:hypothetical protein